MSEACALVLEDGSVYQGRSFGAPGAQPGELVNAGVLEQGAGEVVFNTGMTGYHEILTDPSYTGQIVTMTYPIIGNYGTDDTWSEVGPEQKDRSRVKAAGLVVRGLYEGAVPNGRVSLHEFLKRNRVPGIFDVDTRSLTIKIRNGGSLNGVIIRQASRSGGISSSEKAACMSYLATFPPMVGRDLLSDVGTSEPVVYNEAGTPHFLLIDCGIKANIIRELVMIGCKVSVLPSSASRETIQDVGADALLLSNGPGDPAVLGGIIETIKQQLGSRPLFGICLGHQLICEALGARTRKMRFGHHGINHPVRDELTGRVFVTSQNHGFDVDEKSLPEDVRVWFRNANDQTIEGIIHENLPIMTSQFHPESAPGPTDSTWIFRSFVEKIQSWSKE